MGKGWKLNGGILEMSKYKLSDDIEVLLDMLSNGVSGDTAIELSNVFRVLLYIKDEDIRFYKSFYDREMNRIDVGF